MDTINQNKEDLIERSRNSVLDFGYTLIVFKSRAKKALTILRKRFTSYYF